VWVEGKIVATILCLETLERLEFVLDYSKTKSYYCIITGELVDQGKTLFHLNNPFKLDIISS